MKNLAGWGFYRIFLSFKDGRRLIWERFSSHLDIAYHQAHEITLKEFPGEFPDIEVSIGGKP